MQIIHNLTIPSQLPKLPKVRIYTNMRDYALYWFV